jgi:hypothetical protein
VLVAIGSSGFNETWEWTGDQWLLHSGAGTPRGIGFGLAYDSLIQRVVLFGIPAEQNYEWDGSTWQGSVPDVQPPPRLKHGMAADDARGRLILFGGKSTQPGQMPLADTWERTASGWIERFPTQAPPAGVAALAHDASRARTVLVTSAGGSVETWPMTRPARAPCSTRAGPTA